MDEGKRIARCWDGLESWTVRPLAACEFDFRQGCNGHDTPFTARSVNRSDEAQLHFADRDLEVSVSSVAVEVRNVPGSPRGFHDLLTEPWGSL